MSMYYNSQEVRLEAAILKRVRNSSLVECPCAENVMGLSTIPKTRIVGISMPDTYGGRRAFFHPLKIYRKEHWRSKK